MRLGWEGVLLVAAEDIESCAGQKVVFWVEVDAVFADAMVGYGAVEGGGVGSGLRVDGHSELEVHRQGEADDIEAWA